MANARDLSILAQGASTAGILAGTYGGTGASLSPTTAGNVIFSTDGSTFSSTQKIVRGTSVSASGTAVDFTSIPSWVKRITIMLNGVSLTSTGNYLYQVGTGGTPTTSGYSSFTAVIGGSGTTFPASSTAGIIHWVATASVNIYASIVFVNVSGNIWLATGVGAGGTTSGGVTLSGTLDMVRITNTATGTNSFDAGTINILYE